MNHVGHPLRALALMCCYGASASAQVHLHVHGRTCTCSIPKKIYKSMHMCLCGYAYTAWRARLHCAILVVVLLLISDVVGVAELCNKVGGKCVNDDNCNFDVYMCVYMYTMTLCTGKFFTKYDQELAATFSAYCGISLYHVSILQMFLYTQWEVY